MPYLKTMSQQTNQFIQSGGRKTARAAAKLVPGSSSQIIVNGKTASVYFQDNAVFLQNILTVYESIKTETIYDAFIEVKGGGLSSQAQASRLALCKAFLEVFPNLRSYFKKRGFLTRDARIKERRKYGLKKARKAPQFSKR
jgi:small subunit ribosomal protein S9